MSAFSYSAGSPFCYGSPMKMTPVLLVKSIEASLPFWADRLGWQKTVEIPDGDSLGFVILVREETELMLQTIENARKDLPALVETSGSHRTALFIEVNDWPDIRGRLSTYPITMQERETLYGMREIGVLDPDLNIIVFAQQLSQSGIAS